MTVRPGFVFDLPQTFDPEAELGHRLELIDSLLGEAEEDAGPPADAADGDRNDTVIRLSPTVEQFVHSTADVVLCWSARGEGKSVGAVIRILKVAQDNPAAWPLRVACVRDTWVNIKRTVFETLWQGQRSGWWDVEFRAGETEAILDGGVAKLFFFGMDRAADANKFQGFEAGLLWLEEPAPAADISSGIPAEVFAMGVSSLRQPGVERPTVQITMNPPDRSHWTLELQETLEEAGHPDMRCEVFRIPVGENTHLPPGYRERMRLGLEAAQRPDLIRRLSEGNIGTVIIGLPVTPEFSDLHVAKKPIQIRLGWPTYRGYDAGLNPTCFRRDTELLTDVGWRLFSALSGTELIATRNPVSGHLEFQAPTRIIRQYYAGPLVTYRSHNVDFAVTPDHQLAIWKEHGRASIAGHERIRADALWSGTVPHASVDLTAMWTGSDEGEYGPEKWPAVLWARFLGWHLSEGSTTARGSVTVYQKNPHPLLTKVLSDTGLRWSRHRLAYTTWHPRLAQVLRACGLVSTTKRVPREVFGFTQATIRAFLECFIAGDGSTRRHPNGSYETTIYTASPGLADDLQDLALRAGWFARVFRRPPRTSTIHESDGHSRQIVGTGDWCIRLKTGAQRSWLLGKYVGRVHYDGMVYCVTVPNGTLYVRRNGIAHWNGNCIHAQTSPAGHLNIIGCVVGMNMGMEELLEVHVIPWEARMNLRSVAPKGKPPRDDYGHVKTWTKARAMVRFRDIGDPACVQREQTHSERSVARIIENLLHTTFEKGRVELSARKNSMRAVMTRNIGGRPMLQVDPDCVPLIEALEGAWHHMRFPSGKISELPVKNLASHPGDAFSYLCSVLYPSDELTRRALEPPRSPVRKPASWAGR